MNVWQWLGKLLLCMLPPALTPLWAYLIAESYLNFGGGCKDLVLLLPWALWSALYSLAFIVGWIKRLPTLRILAWSVGTATGLIILVWVIMVIWYSPYLGMKTS